MLRIRIIKDLVENKYLYVVVNTTKSFSQTKLDCISEKIDGIELIHPHPHVRLLRDETNKFIAEFAYLSNHKGLFQQTKKLPIF